MPDERKPVKPIRAWMVMDKGGKPVEVFDLMMTYPTRLQARRGRTAKGERVIPVEIREVRGRKTNA